MSRKRDERVREAAYITISAALLAGAAAALWAIFGWPWERIAQSATYQWRCLVFFVTGIAQGGGGEWSEAAPGSSSPYFAAIASSMGGIAFVFRAWAAALLCPEAEGLAALGLLDAFDRLLQIAVWIPYVFLIGYLLKKQALEKGEKDRPGKSKALAFWEGWPKKAAGRAAGEAEAYLAWIREDRAGRAFPAALAALFLAFSKLGPAALDLAGFYLVFTRSLFAAPVLPAIAALLADAAECLARMWPAGDAAIGVWAAFLILRRQALGMLREMQAQNEAEAAELAISTILTGPPGIGKTKMMTSMAIDLESQMTDQAFSIMKKYAMAFPKFPWASLEGWVGGKMKEEYDANGELAAIKEKLASESGLGKEEREKLEAREREIGAMGLIANRSQLRAEILRMFADYKASGFDPALFFGYDAAEGLFWFDGAKEIYLPEAADAYAEAWFLYFPGLPLAATNYAIRFRKGLGGDGFPLYEAPSAYLAKGCRPEPSEGQYSAIADFDARRIAKKLDPLDQDSWRALDGCVEAYTEIDKERGNKDDYVGMRKKDDPNPTNDGFNWSIKLTRHDFTIDGAPFTKILFDTQRPDSVNADLRESSEDSIYIWDRGPTESALPFWGIDQAITSWVVGHWMAYYYAFRNARPGVETLYNRVLAAIARPFFQHLERMTNSYGFERVVYRHQVGGTGNISGKAVTEEYYFIRRKTESRIYASDCYRAIGDRRRLGSKEGYLDAPRYGDVEMTVEEMERQNSYFIKKLEDEMKGGGKKEK